MNLAWRCLIGLHDWYSVKVGDVPGRKIEIGPVVVVERGFDLWENACARCEKFVSMTTYPYAREAQRRTRG